MDLTINANNTSIQLAGIKSTDKTEETQAEEATTETIAATQTRKYDTVELSEEAESYLSEDETTLTEDTTTEEVGLNILEEYESSDSEDDEDEIEELYTYTDDELSELLANGDITRLEYNTEMARRTSSVE